MTIIGLLDSGLPDGQAIQARRFGLDGDGAVLESAAEPDAIGHGTALASVIAARAPGTRLLNAQVFDRRGVASPAAAAAGIRWLVAEGARLINLSFGLTQDRAVLAEACAEAVLAGVLLVASTPAMGPRVFPAAYPGVVRVTGDGRCRTDEISDLDGDRADFGANPRLDRNAGASGASVATARVTAALSCLLVARPDLNNGELLRCLAAQAEHRGPQRDHLGGSP